MPWLVPEWGADFSDGVRVGLEQWLRRSAHPLGGAGCRDHAQSPAFAPDTSEGAVGFWPFLHLIVSNLSRLQMCVVIFSIF